MKKLLLITATVFLIQFASIDLRAGEIHTAASTGDMNKVRALIKANLALLESKDGDGNTPLISACNSLQLVVANFLIDTGANVKAIGMMGGTPLFFAIKDSDACFNLVQRLIEKGADVNAKMSFTGRNWTVLCKAIVTGNHKTGNFKVVKLLIDHGVDLNIRDIEGTPLQIAINNNPKKEIATLLIESGAKLQEFSFGNTELHMVALKGYEDMVPLLVNKGADVNAVNDYNHTALYYAAKHGYRKTADSLIASGANENTIIETNYDNTPQLTTTLKEGEAYLWYLGGGSPCDGYVVKTKEHLLIFNPSGISESPEASLANGYINPKELAGQKITVLINHQSGDEHAPSVSELIKAMPNANFILNLKPADSIISKLDISSYRLAIPNESFSMGEIQVHTIPAMLKVFFDNQSLGYLIEADGVKILHPGLHVSDNVASNVAKYRKEIDFLKPFGPIDIAILPVKGRHIEHSYEPYLYLIDQLSPKAIYLIGDDLVTEEHKVCVKVLQARNVPVMFPEGGIAIGERFHYQLDSMTTINKKKVWDANIQVNPNPTTGMVNVSFGNSVKNPKAEIYNLQGNQVFSKTYINTPSTTIDLTGLPTGIYVVKVIANGVSYEEKIVKE